MYVQQRDYVLAWRGCKNRRYKMERKIYKGKIKYENGYYILRDASAITQENAEHVRSQLLRVSEEKIETNTMQP